MRRLSKTDRARILVQVDLAGEATNSGALADAARRLIDAAVEARAVNPAGLMVLPPWNEDQEQTRPVVPQAAAAAGRMVCGGIQPGRCDTCPWA